MAYTNRVTRDYIVTGVQWRQLRTYMGTTSSWNSNSDVSSKSLVATRSGTSNPLWRSQVKAGDSAGTPYSLSGVRRVTSSPGTCVYRYYNGSGSGKVTMQDTVTGFCFPHTEPTSYVTTFSKADTAALLQVYRKIGETANQWQGLSFVAEFTDVVRQFGSPFKALVDYTHQHLNRVESSIRGLRGSRKQRRLKMIKLIADTYLEYVFGLAPLISDTKKAAEALARFEYEGDPTNNPALRKRAVGRGSETYVKDVATSKVRIFDSMINSYIDKREESVARVQYIVGLSTALVADYGTNRRLLQLLGVTPSRVPAAVYEAIPWSWLLDYFTNVGDILESIGVDVSSVKWINKTTTKVDTLDLNSRVDVVGTKVLAAAYGYSTESLVGLNVGHWRCVRTVLERTIPSTLGWPSFQWDSPIGDKHQNGKLANMAAVLISRQATIPRLAGTI